MAAEYLLFGCRLWFIEALGCRGFALRQRLSSTKRQREAQGSEPVARSAAAAEVTKEWKGGEGNDKSLSERTRRQQEEEEKSNKRESERE